MNIPDPKYRIGDLLVVDKYNPRQAIVERSYYDFNREDWIYSWGKTTFWDSAEETLEADVIKKLN